MQRCVDCVSHVKGKTKSGRHNTDDRECAPVKFHRPVHHVAVTGKVVLPQVIAQHRNVALAGLLFARQIGAAQQRLHAENLEEVVGGADAVKQHRAARWRIHCVVAVVVVPCQRRKGVDLRPFVFIRRPGGRLLIAAPAVAVDAYDSPRIRVRQRAQNHRVDHAEHRRSHAHAQGQRHHYREGESRGASQLPQRIAQVLKNHR